MDGRIPTDEEYYQRQSNIYSLLFQAYMDKYILDSIDHFKTSLPKERMADLGDTILVMAHICELTKKDLTLTVWKVYYDNGGDANTVKGINRYLFRKYGIKRKFIETEKIKTARSLLCSARKNFIAHNLMNDSGRLLQISDLIDALQDIRALFNAVSLESIDYRVRPLTDAQVYSLSFYEKMGVDLMLRGFLDSHGDSSAI